MLDKVDLICIAPLDFVCAIFIVIVSYHIRDALPYTILDMYKSICRVLIGLVLKEGIDGGIELFVQF